MRLLKTHAHTSERHGYEARENANKVIEGNEDTIRRQTRTFTQLTDGDLALYLAFVGRIRYYYL